MERYLSSPLSATEEEVIRLTSVGIDIGTSTSQLLFSSLELERNDSGYSLSRRKTLFQSEVLMTPYRSDVEIDGARLQLLVDEVYRQAGVGRHEVDTGALITTGLALLSQNARAIANVFAREAGKLVAVAAGDNLEAGLAAHGSGAVQMSETVGTVMNIDIGGGTTKVALCRDGAPVALMAMNIGARIVAFDHRRVIVRCAESAIQIGNRLGIDVRVGGTLSLLDADRLASYMIGELIGEVSQGGRSLSSSLLRGPALQDRSEIDGVVISGGVSEYFYDRTSSEFGDLGMLLGMHLRSRVHELKLPVYESEVGVRATVIGASQFSTQVSGSTIHVAHAVLPLRNIPVVMPEIPWGVEEFEPSAVAALILKQLHYSDLIDSETPVALAIRWSGPATYARLSMLSVGIARAMNAHTERGHPLIVVCERDIAGVLGLHLQRTQPEDVPVIAIDSITLGAFDYIDIGEPIANTGSLPVVVRSLLFGPRQGGVSQQPFNGFG